MANPQPKALRVGVVQGGKIVEERTFAEPATVRIGSGARNTFVLPQSNLPESFVLFQPEGAGVALAFDEGMRGRVEGPGGSTELDVLARGGRARRQGERWLLPLAPEERGRVALGEATVLWQFVVPAPEAPRPVLPPEARQHRFQTLDRLFVTILAISLSVNVAGYVALANTPSREDVTLEEIPDRFAKLLIPERKPEPPRPVEERKAEPTPEPVKAEEPKKAEPKKAESEAKVAEDKAARAAEVRKAVQSKGILRVLGALGPGTATGAVADVFGTGGGFGDVASALSGAGGVAIATDPSAGGARKGGGGGGAATIGDLATSGGGKVALGAKSEARVSGRVAAEDAEIDSPDIDQGKLGSFVRARINSIKTCYENALKRNPSLKGKIRIRFTILETGGLADIVVLENSMGSPEVATCIASFMRSWRTPFHPAGTVSVEYPFVFTAQ
jgi:outer membrane biosynthesis protein TonB